MAKYDYEFRLKVMKSYLKGEGGILSLQKIQYKTTSIILGGFYKYKLTDLNEL